VIIGLHPRDNLVSVTFAMASTEFAQGFRFPAQEFVHVLADERRFEPDEELRGPIGLVVMLAVGEHGELVEVFGEPRRGLGDMDKAVWSRSVRICAQSGRRARTGSASMDRFRGRLFERSAGATKLHQLDDAIASVDVKLSAEEIAALEEPYVPHAVVSFE
jgi:hypothetical protein